MKIDKLGRTPLHYVAIDLTKEKQSKEIAGLIENGYDPNQQDNNGWTPLHFAAQARSSEAVTALLNASSEVDITDANGNTPLWRAVFSAEGEGDIIEALLNAGADPDKKNLHGVSPRELADTVANYNLKVFFK